MSTKSEAEYICSAAQAYSYISTSTPDPGSRFLLPRQVSWLMMHYRIIPSHALTRNGSDDRPFIYSDRLAQDLHLIPYSPPEGGTGAVLMNCDEEHYNTPAQMEQCHS